jgi:hypothetical protein
MISPAKPSFRWPTALEFGVCILGCLAPPAESRGEPAPRGLEYRLQTEIGYPIDWPDGKTVFFHTLPS